MMMARIKTHYDNLKVDRQAPAAVIKAAWKVLSQIEHPDRNPGPEAERRMATINASYDILSDETRRAEHDAWIAEQERQQQMELAAQQQKRRRPAAPTLRRPARDNGTLLQRALDNPLPTLVIVMLFLGVCAMLIMGLSAGKSSDSGLDVVALTATTAISASPAPPDTKSLTPVLPAQSAPPEAAKGHQWPVQSGPISGYEQLAAIGLSTVSIDNSANAAAIYLKLVQIPGERVVRHIYVRGNAKYTITDIDDGQYAVRYKSIASPIAFESLPFALGEGDSSSGITLRLDLEPVDTPERHLIAAERF